MTIMWAQGDLGKALQQSRLAESRTRPSRRARTTPAAPVAGSLRPAPAR